MALARLSILEGWEGTPAPDAETIPQESSDLRVFHRLAIPICTALVLEGGGAGGWGVGIIDACAVVQG